MSSLRPLHNGKDLPISAARRLIADVMHFSRQVPAVTIERSLRLAALVAARNAMTVRTGWCAILTKAFALVAARVPELRRSWLCFPRARLYEHPVSVATVAVERRYASEKCVFFAPLPAPDRLSLNELDAQLAFFKKFPVPGIAAYRLAVKVSHWPLYLRRIAWWGGLNISGALRAQTFGTFGVTTTASLGATPVSVLSPLTATLHYGPIRRNGCLDMRLTFDHRVLDGGTAARALIAMERVLLDRIVGEISHLRGRDAA